MSDLLEEYGNIPVSELRDDLRKVRQLRTLDIDAIPDPVVRMFHMLVVSGNDDEAPEWYKNVATFCVNAQRDGEAVHAQRREEDKAVIRDLKARLGEDTVRDFFANAI